MTAVPVSAKSVLQVERLVADMQLFRTWPAERLHELIKLMRVIHAKAGWSLMRQGEVAKGLFAIVSGSVEVSVDHEDGRRFIRRFAQAGMLFGLVSVIDGEGATYSYIAQEESEILFVDRSAFLGLLSRHPTLWPSVARHLGDFQRMALASLQDQIFENLQIRLIRVLISLAKSHGIAMSPRPSLAIQVTQEELGSFLGVSRQSVNKELKRLSKAQLVRVAYRQIVLKDVSTLERRVRDYAAKGPGASLSSEDGPLPGL